MRLAMQDIDQLPPSPSSRLNRSGHLTFAVNRRDHEARLAVAGELDLATVDSLCLAAADVLHPPIRAVLLDLDGVSFCGAAGVTALIQIHRAAANARIRLVLTGIQPQVRRVLDLAGTSGVIPIARTRAKTPFTFDSPNTHQASPAASLGNTGDSQPLLAHAL
jgi:anti-anti-sigma factor